MLPVFLTDFPPELASLAKTRTDDDGELVAARFELYIEGLELANAYDELVDAAVLGARFEADNAERARLGLHVMPIDEYLLAAFTTHACLFRYCLGCRSFTYGCDRKNAFGTGD